MVRFGASVKDFVVSNGRAAGVVLEGERWSLCLLHAVLARRTNLCTSPTFVHLCPQYNRQTARPSAPAPSSSPPATLRAPSTP